MKEEVGGREEAMQSGGRGRGAEDQGGGLSDQAGHACAAAERGRGERRQRKMEVGISGRGQQRENNSLVIGSEDRGVPACGKKVGRGMGPPPPPIVPMTLQVSGSRDAAPSWSSVGRPCCPYRCWATWT